MTTSVMIKAGIIVAVLAGIAPLVITAVKLVRSNSAYEDDSGAC